MIEFKKPETFEEAEKNLKKMQKIKEDTFEMKVYLKNAIPDGTGIIYRPHGFGYSTSNDGEFITVDFNEVKGVKIDMVQAILDRTLDTNIPGAIDYTERYLLAFVYRDKIDEMLKEAQEDYDRLSGNKE